MSGYIRFLGVLVLGLCFVSVNLWAEERDAYDAYTKVVIQVLNKITARTSIVEINIDDVYEVEKLRIMPKACKKSKPTEAPESIAFLEIDQLDQEGFVIKRIFSGWMFASSPALSALEHPIIDIKVLSCENTEPQMN